MEKEKGIVCDPIVVVKTLFDDGHNRAREREASEVFRVKYEISV